MVTMSLSKVLEKLLPFINLTTSMSKNYSQDYPEREKEEPLILIVTLRRMMLKTDSSYFL